MARIPSTKRLLLMAAITLVGGCLDVTPYPIVDSGVDSAASCATPTDDGGCDDASAPDDASAGDGGTE
jgi:hypothetical protein